MSKSMSKGEQTSNNPANIASAKAKQAGLSYWSRMAQEFPGSVQEYVWPTKKTKRTRAEKVESAVNRSRGRNAMAFLMGIRGLVSGRF